MSYVHDGREWPTSRPGRLTPRKRDFCPLKWWLGRSYSRSGRFREVTKILPLSGFEPWIAHPKPSVCMTALPTTFETFHTAEIDSRAMAIRQVRQLRPV